MARSQRSWYRGDCHVHTRLSVAGELTPAQVRLEAVGLDFIAITEHNRVEPLGQIDDPELDFLNDLLVMTGQEVVTSRGHWLAVGLPAGMPVDPDHGTDGERLQGCLDEVHAVGGMCVAAHPFAPYPTGMFTYGYDGFDAIEVWNGRWSGPDAWQADNEAALSQWRELLAAGARNGDWLPAMANSDAHRSGQLRGPHNVVLAETLTPQGVLAGLRAGHSWLAESTSVDLIATAQVTDVRRRPIDDSSPTIVGPRASTFGERLITEGWPVRVSVAVLGVPSGVVTLHTNEGPVYRDSVPDEGSGTLHWTTGAANPEYVCIEVRHPDGRMAALSNPIFLLEASE
jgi:hypothetical protein